MGDSPKFDTTLLRRGGFRPFNLENMILSYRLGVMAWTMDMYQQLEGGFRTMHAIPPM